MESEKVMLQCRPEGLRGIVNSRGHLPLAVRLRSWMRDVALAAIRKFGAGSITHCCLKMKKRVLEMDTARAALALSVVATLLPMPVLAHGSSSESLVRMSSQREGDVTHFFVENLQAADVTVTLEVTSENLKSSNRLPLTRTVPGKERIELASVSPVAPEKPWKWSYTYYATFGSLDAKHDDSYVYALPYAPGHTFRVSQGFCGKYSHFGPNEFAIDWKMPLGTAVHAARAGVVVAVKDDSDFGGGDSSYDTDANYVLICHSDGTLGHYVHLLKDGARVQVGNHVRTGDLIALSGNTGHSTGPHLHFSVFKARNGKERETVPIRYQTASGDAVVLETGKNYKALGTPAILASPKGPVKETVGMGGS